MIIMDGVAENFYGLAVFIAFLVGLLLGGVFFAKGDKNAVAKANEEIASLKNELESVTKQSTVVKEQLDSALESSKSLALSWAKTYQNLEAAKATMEGDDVTAQKYMLAIKNGKFEKIEYKDEDVESLKAKAKDKAKEVKEAVADKAKATTEAVKDAAKDAKDALADKAQDVKETAKEVTKDAKEVAKDTKDAVVNKAKDVKEATKEVAKDAKEVAKDVKDTVVAKASDAKEGLKDAVQTTKEAVVNTAKDVKDATVKQVNNLKK